MIEIETLTSALESEKSAVLTLIYLVSLLKVMASSKYSLLRS